MSEPESWPDLQSMSRSNAPHPWLDDDDADALRDDAEDSDSIRADIMSNVKEQD
jgi:hypothetical protein